MSKLLQIEDIEKEYSAVEVNKSLNETVITCADMCKYMEWEKTFLLRNFSAEDANAAFYIFIHFATLIITQKGGDVKKFSKRFNKLMKDFIA